MVSVEVPFGEKHIAATIDLPGSSAKPKICIILTHGAGGDKDIMQLVNLSQMLSDAGYLCVRFTCKSLNIKHRTKIFVVVVRYICENYPNIQSYIFGGRSMGSRSALAAARCIYQSSKSLSSGKVKKPLKRKLDSKDTQSAFCTNCGAVHPKRCKIIGILCISFPLNPIGNKADRSLTLIESVPLPHLFVSGNNDEMCNIEHLKQTMSSMPQLHMQPVFKLAVSEVPFMEMYTLHNPTILAIVLKANHALKIKGEEDCMICRKVGAEIVKWVLCISKLVKHTE